MPGRGGRGRTAWLGGFGYTTDNETHTPELSMERLPTEADGIKGQGGGTRVAEQLEHNKLFTGNSAVLFNCISVP